MRLLQAKWHTELYSNLCQYGYWDAVFPLSLLSIFHQRPCIAGRVPGIGDNMICPKIGLPLESGMAKCHPGFLLSATVATVAKVLRVPHKTPSRPLRALRFTRLLQTQVLPPPCRSAGYAARRAWFCSHTLPDVLPTGGWHSHSDVW